MVYVITGGINQGKTNRLVSIYKLIQKGDGFFCRKIFLGSEYAGQEIVRMSTGDYKLLFLNKCFVPEGWDEELSYDIYSFSKSGFDFARDIVNYILKNKISPVFIDEIGPLELLGEGHYKSFKLLLENGNDIYVIVRETCLNDMISRFGISNHMILS